MEPGWKADAAGPSAAAEASCCLPLILSFTCSSELWSAYWHGAVQFAGDAAPATAAEESAGCLCL